MHKSSTKSLTIKQITRSQRWYRKYLAALGSFLVTFCAASALAPVHNSGASQLVDVTNENTGYYVRVSGSDSVAIDVDANPSGQLAGGKDTITTVTNSPRGYQLYISASSSYLYLNGDASSGSKFSPIGGDLTSAIALGIDTWGFALDTSAAGVATNNFATKDSYTASVPTSSATYASLPTSATMVQSIDAANYPDGTDLDIYYGIKASSNLPTGSYQATITYTALSDGVNNNADYMQDFTADMCSALPTSTSGDVHEVELIDKRDMKWYRVAKLADGHCWMVQNLALDGDITLTPKDSNVTKNRYLDANIENGEDSVNDKVQIYSGVAEMADANGSKYGNLYNFMAATAGVGDENSTGTVYESVCPKGWRLPDNSGDYSWSNLMGKSGLSATNTTNATYVAQAQQAPLYIPLAGSYTSSADSQGRHAYQWIRVANNSDANSAYNFSFNADSGGFFPQGSNGYKSSGFSVRCVFEGSFDQITYMQELTTSICKSTAEGATANLLDKRGRGNAGSDTTSGYGILKAKDGNCWMTDNLKYDIAESTDWDTNITDQPKLHIATNSGYESEYYYNWTAAIQSCPTNWQLPVNGNATVDKSFSKLLSKYNISTGNELIANMVLGFKSYYGLWGFGPGAETGQGLQGTFWTQTAYTDLIAYRLLYSDDSITLQENTYSKSNGLSVRCVLGE